MAAEAAEQGYRETGVQSYRFEAALDLKTCTVCGALDQREFPLAEHETGINYPPLHPRCRCTTVPVTEFRTAVSVPPEIPRPARPSMSRRS